jgi:hypothetical protein
VLVTLGYSGWGAPLRTKSAATAGRTRRRSRDHLDTPVEKAMSALSCWYDPRMLSQEAGHA